MYESPVVLPLYRSAHMPDKFSEALEESERSFAKKRARIVVCRQIESRLRAIYDADLNRPIPPRIIALFETSVTSD
jgi:hypothetical protein